MKKYLVLLLFALITTVSFGQSNYQEVVYLKDGSIIRGVIIEIVPNKSIKIETVGRNVFSYQMDEIEKIRKEQYQDKSNVCLNNKGLQDDNKVIVELGYQIGLGSYGMDRLKLNIINYCYQINPYFSLGCGTGLRYYFDEETALIPVFADLKANFINKKGSPYFSLGVGYSFDAGNGFEGVGFLLSPTVGVRFKVSEKSAMNIGLGYEMQRMDVYQYHDGYTNIKNSGAISINVGISF